MEPTMQFQGSPAPPPPPPPQPPRPLITLHPLYMEPDVTWGSVLVWTTFLLQGPGHANVGTPCNQGGGSMTCASLPSHDVGLAGFLPPALSARSNATPNDPGTAFTSVRASEERCPIPLVMHQVNKFGDSMMMAKQIAL